MKKIIIIGGGIAGLSAGIYAQRSGFDSLIIEKNSNIGGECTGWMCEGCYIDGCIHWLTGSNYGELNGIWKSVGALDGAKIIEPEYLYKYVSGTTNISIYRNIDKFKNELLTIAPEDTERIGELIGYIKGMEKMTMPIEPIDQMNLFQLMKFGLSMRRFSKAIKILSRITIGEYAATFKNQTLRNFILSYMPPEYQLMTFIVSIATFTGGNGNIPEGSSVDFANRIKDRYLSLGGKIKLSTEATDIVIAGKRAESVVAATGESFKCDYVIPACDVDITYHKLLKGKCNDKAFEKRYSDEVTNPLIANCYFAYAVDGDVAKCLPHMSMLECGGVTVCGKTKTLVGLKVYDYIDNGNGLVTAISPPATTSTTGSGFIKRIRQNTMWKRRR